MKNYQAILIVLISYGIAYGILTGKVQQYVHFAGELNELGCFIIAGSIGTLTLFAIDYKKILKAFI